MSELVNFMRKNKIEKEHVFFALKRSFPQDADGSWPTLELRSLTSGELQKLRKAHMRQIPTRKGAYRTTVDDGFIDALICACVVSPDLDDAALQDDYGVMGAEELLTAIVDNVGDYNELVETVTQLCGITDSLDDEVETAKN